MKSTTAFDDQFSEEPDSTLARTGNTADHQDGWYAGIDHGRAEARASAQDDAKEYGSPTDVAHRIEQYLAHDGRENSATLLLYEAMKALRAPAAGDARAPALNIEAAAIALAECMDYPWAHMPDPGRAAMREHAQTVIRAASQQQEG